MPGIDIFIHATFVVVFGWVAVLASLRGRNAHAMVVVLLHDFGHAVTAKRFGIRTRDFTLLPIGSVAERLPKRCQRLEKSSALAKA